MNFEFPPDEAIHQALARDQGDLDALARLLKIEALSDLVGPVLVAFDLPMLLRLSQINNQPRALLQNHAPKVLLGLRQRALRRDERLVIELDGAVDVVGVDVRVGNVGAALHEADASVLERLHFGVAVQVHLVLVERGILLVGEVLPRLRQFPYQSKLRLDISHKRLPLEI